MIDFGKDNEEFGQVPPSLISCEEMREDEGFADNALIIKIMNYTGRTLQIVFPSYIII